jgi:hypothetical protein
MATAKAVKAVLTGFGLREPFTAEAPASLISPGSPAGYSRRWRIGQGAW